MKTTPVSQLNEMILVIRGRKVMLSSHLASLYGVEVRALMQAVKRNAPRFPDDFMFQLSTEEVDALRSQNVILENPGKGRHSKYLPYAFTQEGIAMLSSVLHSPSAITANIAIMRAFVRVRELMSSHRNLALKIEALERRYNGQFQVVFNSIRRLIEANPKDLVRVPSGKRLIGFGRDVEE
jgi:hypothetical protein